MICELQFAFEIFLVIFGFALGFWLRDPWKGD
jgi:hypothetical protein